jgi:hypothetical protein
MATFNRVEGFENEVVFYGRKAMAYRALNSSDYMVASACLRMGWVSNAVRCLLSGRPLPDDADVFEDPDGEFHGTDAYVTHLLTKVIASGKATPEERRSLHEAFPLKFESAQGAGPGL